MIFTFYSYKGGVGRTMALVNIAELFYQSGLKVLMIDWDLEAPGLERFFPIAQDEILQRSGIIDILLQYKDQMASEVSQSSDNQALPLPNPEEYIIDLYPNKAKDAKLWLLSAGKRDGENFSKYAYKVRTFDWADFYSNWEGELYIEWMRQQLESLADVVLIDSRTGVTEMGGICAYQFADAVVLMCTPNQQSLDGTYQMVKDLTRPEVQILRHGRSLDLLVIPSRVEDRAEVNLLSKFKIQFTDKFDSYVSKKIQADINSFWELKIPYVPYYSFNESVVIENNIHSEELLQVFTQLTTTLARFAKPETRLHQWLLDKKYPLKQKEKQESLPIQSDEGLSVTLWGPTGSGKTWLITAFARVLEYYNQDNSDFYYGLYELIPGSEDARPVQATQPTNWPTPNMQDYFWLFKRVATGFNLAPGSVVVNSQSHIFRITDTKGSDILELQDPLATITVAESSCLILMFDLSLAHSNDNPDALASSYQEWYLTSVQRLCAILRKSKHKKHVAVCLSKCDLVPIIRDPWSMLQIYFGEDIFQQLRSLAVEDHIKLEVFAVSAAGYLGKNATSRRPNYDHNTGSLRDLSNWEPYNVEQPFFWVFEYIERARILNSQDFMSKLLGLSRERAKKYMPYPNPKSKGIL